MDSLTQTNPHVNSIISEYAAQGVRYAVIHAEPGVGKVMLYRDLRGNLTLAHFPAITPSPSILPLTVERYNGERATDAETAEWLAEAAALFGIAPVAEAEPTAPALSPAAAVAADLKAEYADHPRAAELRKRIDSALALVEAGEIEFPQHETSFSYHGLHGRRFCLCADARFRSLSAKWGVACKHTIAQEIAARVAAETDSVAQRKLVSKTERRRATALPASVDQRAAIDDMLGYDEPDPARTGYQPETRSLEQQWLDSKAALPELRYQGGGTHFAFAQRRQS